MPHLKQIARKPAGSGEDGFPFAVPAIATLPTLALSPRVTLFVGENGSGKSTLLEAIALAAGLPTVGAAESVADQTLASQRRLAGALRLTWAKRVHRGFFLRAEDFFGFQKRVVQQQAEMRARMQEVDTAYADRSDWAKGLAKGPAAASLADLARRYGEQPDARSHGEAFLDLFRGRFVPDGLYLLDEPEAALSPQSQLGLLAMLLDMVPQRAQFVIATHSPILLAYPEALIYSFDRTPVGPVAYDDLDHVKLTRDFLSDPRRFLRRLRHGT
jgi:predicted ATPase